MRQDFSTSIGERRLIHLFQTMGENVGTFVNDTIIDKYTVRPWKEPGNWWGRALAPIAIVGSLIGESGEVLYRGAVDQKAVTLEGIGARTRRDVNGVLENLIPFYPTRPEGDKIMPHPLKILGSGWSLLTSDLPLDAIDLVGGYSQSSRSNMRQALQSTHDATRKTTASI